MVISQKFHNHRAGYIAESLGLDAVGYNARGVRGRSGAATWAREVLARVKMLLDVHVLGTDPKFLGDPIRIGIDDPA